MAEEVSGPATSILLFSSFNNRAAELSWTSGFPAGDYISHVPLQGVVMQQIRCEKKCVAISCCSIKKNEADSLGRFLALPFAVL